MKIKDVNISSDYWKKFGYKTPEYDRKLIHEKTMSNPEWLHLGAGNIFRAFIAKDYQQVLNDNKSECGIIVAEGFDYEIIEYAYRRFDNLSVTVSLKSSGEIEKHLVGSVVESLMMDTESDDWNVMKDIFSAKSLKMVSFTITEKGYSIKNDKMEFIPSVASDFLNGPNKPITYIGKVAALCYHRYQNGAFPIALVSMDNCSHNGDLLLNAVHEYAKHWVENGHVESGFYDYLCNKSCVSFPWSAIDKITPRPDETVKAKLIAEGLEDIDPIITSKKTYVAPFVNAEETQYLVVEDSFPNGRPTFYGEGVYFTDRETVDRFERMKVCTCLNPLHTCLAMFGCLLGYKLISEEMKNEKLRTLVERIAFDESMPVVSNPGIIDPIEFAKTVLNVRFTNPYNPDSPQRIAMDTSQKLSIRFGETIKTYVERQDLNVKDLKYIPLVLAAWCRYLLGVDDNGQKFELSFDPMLETLVPMLSNIKLGEARDFHNELETILSNPKIFGVNLYEVGLGDLVEQYFAEMVSGTGAVSKLLEKVVE